MYKIGKPISADKVPTKSKAKAKPTFYTEIWNELENIDNKNFIPVEWENWALAERFYQACKMKKIGKKGRPNPYRDLDFARIDNVVYIRGRKGLQWGHQSPDGATII